MEKIKRQTENGRVFITPGYLRDTLMLAAYAVQLKDEATEFEIECCNELTDRVCAVLPAAQWDILEIYCLKANGPEIVAASVEAFLNATHPHGGDE
jgi:hypothetical protein